MSGRFKKSNKKTLVVDEIENDLFLNIWQYQHLFILA